MQTQFSYNKDLLGSCKSHDCVADTLCQKVPPGSTTRYICVNLPDGALPFLVWLSAHDKKIIIKKMIKIIVLVLLLNCC